MHWPLNRTPSSMITTGALIAPSSTALGKSLIFSVAVMFPIIFPLLITVAALWGVSGLRFDTNLFDLLPRNAESLRYQRKMVLDSDLSPLFSIVVAADAESLAEMQRRAEAEPRIERFESVLTFLPREPELAERTLAELARRLDRVELPETLEPLDRDSLGSALQHLEEALALAADDAFNAGLSDWVAPLEDVRAQTEALLELVSSAGETEVEAWNRHQPRLLDMARRTLNELRRVAVADAPTLDNLPLPLRERFLTRSGALLGFLYPVGDVFEPEQLEAYVAASRRVDKDVTGFPVVFHKMSGRITSGFYRAVLVGGALVALILLIDYRNLRHALLALVPLGLGLIWMTGGMRLFGISFNFANLVAVPLILGVGIDNGVHVIHRVRLEGDAGAGAVLRHTGRAILIASLTTMIGFGSLALASHRGVASLGYVLILGVGSCLITSTVVLPNLLVLLRIVKR